MQAGDGEAQSRRFEKNGDEKGLVTYDPKTETYELEELGTHQTFQFDNIDLAAMEIYDLMDFDEDEGTNGTDSSDQAQAWVLSKADLRRFAFSVWIFSDLKDQ